jgi:hypothetical protein
LFKFPAEFNGSFTFTGGSVTFSDVIFNNTVEFGPASAETFGWGGSKTVFNRSVNFDSAQVYNGDGKGGFGGPVTFNGNARFNQDVDFAGVTTVGGALTLPKGGSFTEATTVLRKILTLTPLPSNCSMAAILRQMSEP